MRFSIFIILFLYATAHAAADLDALNAKFALPDGTLKFVPGEGGLPCADIHTPLCTARIYIQGSQVAAWQPAGSQPVLFMSPKCVFAQGKPMRGGVPICFPWYGSLPGDPTAPGHGFARIMYWDIDSTSRDPAGNITVIMSLKNNDITHKHWDYDFVIRHTVIFGQTLTMRLDVTNTGKKPMQYAEVLHSYFAVKDVSKVSITGLDGADYIDKADGRNRIHQTGPVAFEGEMDRLYVGTRAACTITDPLLARKITIEKTGSDMTAVYNPGPLKAAGMSDLGLTGWPGMACVETLNAEDARVTLPPGAAHQMQAVISVSK